MDWVTPFISDVLSGYRVLITAGLPIVFFIGACNVAINTIVSAAFGGDLRFGRK